MDKAVEEGDFERAVDLSTQLAGREVSLHTFMHAHLGHAVETVSGIEYFYALILFTYNISR